MPPYICLVWEFLVLVLSPPFPPRGPLFGSSSGEKAGDGVKVDYENWVGVHLLPLVPHSHPLL